MLCSVVSDLSDVPKVFFTRKISPDLTTVYYEVHYQLVMTIESATLTFHVEFNGQEYGSAEVKYLHDFNVMYS